MAHPLGSAERPLRVAVAGSGPSGFYAVAALFKQPDLHVTVDLFDRLPTPFGLVRGGVAPDHQKIKNVIRVYNKTAADERFRFFGNVKIGWDLTIDELLTHYDQIVLATGNESDRKMGIEGEELEGVHSATEFVGWFNGHPDFQDRTFDLQSSKRIGVVGNGNVAMDVCRILAQDLDVLGATDITDRALDELRTSQVEDIYLLGRRGPAQAAFSTKEIKEIGALESADLLVSAEEMDLDEVSASWLEGAGPGANKNVDYLKETSAAEPSGSDRRIHCRFLVSPVELGGEDGKLTHAKVELNELYASDDGTPRPRGTGEHETIELDLLFKAVGYRGEPIPGVPFHDAWGIIPNDEGRILDSVDGDPVPNQYVVGWAKRGPSGLIGTNNADSQATVAKMLEDLGEAEPDDQKAPQRIVEVLREKGIDFVDFADWERLDAEEVRLGEAKGKVREKFVDVDSMMETIRRLR